MFMFFCPASGVPQPNNKFFRFKWIRGSFLLATYRFFFLTKLGPIMAWWCSCSRYCTILFVSQLSRYYHERLTTARQEFPRSAIMPDFCLISFRALVCATDQNLWLSPSASQRRFLCSQLCTCTRIWVGAIIRLLISHCSIGQSCWRKIQNALPIIRWVRLGSRRILALFPRSY